MTFLRLPLILIIAFFVLTPAARAAEANPVDSVKMEEVITLGYKDDNTIEYIRHFYRTIKPGWQQSQPPKFVIIGTDHNFLFGIGGQVTFRTAYDFNGVVQDQDFITADIPVTNLPSNR